MIVPARDQQKECLRYRKTRAGAATPVRTRDFAWLILIGIFMGSDAWGADDKAPVFEKQSDVAFARPHDLTLDPSGRFLYIADMDNNVVKVLEPNSLSVIGTIGRGELNRPHDVAFDTAGRLLVADSGNDRIAIYHVEGASGTYLAELRDGFDSPEGVAVDDQGLIYVTNAGLHNIVSVKHGKRLAAAGTHGRKTNEFSRPHDVELGPDGIVYVADPGNNRIQLLNRMLQVVDALEDGPFDFNEPKYLALDEKGWLYVADQYNNRIKIFDETRKPVASIGSEGNSADRPALNRPEGVEARQGNIWVADTYNNRVIHYRWRHR